MSRRYHHLEPDVISPQAARLNGGISGPPRQSRVPGLGGAGSRSRMPNYAGGARQDDVFEDGYGNEEAEARRDYWNHPGGRHNHAEDTRVPLGGHSSSRGHQYNHSEEASELEEDQYRYNQSRDSRQDPFRDPDRFGARSSQHDDVRGRRQPGFADDHSIVAAGARPSRLHHANQRPRADSRGRDVFQENEGYGDSRRGWGNQAHERREGAHREPDVLFGGRDRQIETDSEENEARFVPYTFRMLRRSDVEFLTKIFKVHASEVQQWCKEDYIRMDRMRECETNIDPLLSRLTKRDRENYARALQKMERERHVGEPVGWGPRHVPKSYERGFDAGRGVGDL